MDHIRIYPASHYVASRERMESWISNRAKDLSDYADLRRLAEERDLSPQRLVLAWLMAKSPCVLPIPGASRVESVEDSVPAAEVSLTDVEVRRIDDAV